MVDHDPPYTVKEIAAQRGWHPKLVYELIKSGCPTTKIGRRYFIFPDSLESFLRDHERSGEPIPRQGILPGFDKADFDSP